MKFIFEFVSCCGTPPPSAVLEGPPLEEEPRPPEQRRRDRKDRSRSSSSSVQWQPSLCSISEDIVVVLEEERQPKLEKTPKRRAGSSTKVHVRSYGEDNVRGQFSTLLPTFSPAPFMF